MGYQTTFRLKKELDSKFKPYISKPYDATEKSRCKMLITAECMKNIYPVSEHDDEDERNLSINYGELYKSICWQVRIYALTMQQDWKYKIEQNLKENNNKLVFMGWEYSDGNGRNITSWDSFEEVIVFFTEQLFLKAMHPTNSPFDNEHDDYYNKLEDVTNTIDDIEDAVSGVMDQEFFDFYRDNEELADESDGYSHRFPEEDEEDEDDDETYDETSEDNSGEDSTINAEGETIADTDIDDKISNIEDTKSDIEDDGPKDEELKDEETSDKD